ncbi:hypothetical protein [Oceanobacillus luteolus]|uniref:Uncharacterized protein n=1 Tax=Oceanobacillus luteolus TaxID=1274358 RepID=A0ABW4HNV5_9BACI
MFTKEELKQVISGEAIGHVFPYHTNNPQEIEAHIRRLFYHLKRIPNLIIEAEWDHFGSGYASFVELYCYRKEDVTVLEEWRDIQEIQINGMIINVCRLAPVVIMGEDERSRKYRKSTGEVLSGGSGTLLDGLHRLQLTEKFKCLEQQIIQTLEEFDYQVLDQKVAELPLDFRTSIATLYRDSREYKVMDALFYWED